MPRLCLPAVAAAAVLFVSACGEPVQPGPPPQLGAAFSTSSAADRIGNSNYINCRKATSEEKAQLEDALSDHMRTGAGAACWDYVDAITDLAWGDDELYVYDSYVGDSFAGTTSGNPGTNAINWAAIRSDQFSWDYSLALTGIHEGAHIDDFAGTFSPDGGYAAESACVEPQN